MNDSGPKESRVNSTTSPATPGRSSRFRSAIAPRGAGCGRRGPFRKVGAERQERDVARQRGRAGGSAAGLLPARGRTPGHRAAVQRFRDAPVGREEGPSRHRGALEGAEHVHDLLMSNFERPPATNAAEFMAMSAALEGRSSAAAKLISLLFRLPPRVSVCATIRIIGNALAWARKVDSLATQTSGAVEPSCRAARARSVTCCDPPNRCAPLRSRRVRRRPRGRRARNLQERLRAGPVEFELAVQPFVLRHRDAGRGCVEAVAGGPVPIGLLVIPIRDSTRPRRG